MSSINYWYEHYREKSKQSEEVFNTGFQLKVHPDPKKCDCCGDVCGVTGKDFIALVSSTGVIFYFCTLACLLDFVKEEIREQQKKIDIYGV